METFGFKIDKTEFNITNKSFEEYHGITLSCITFDEEFDVDDFIKHIKPYVNKVVMVDGGSTDRTVEIASKYVDKLKINQFDGHLGNQKNLAISMAQTDWVLFLDPDERLTEKAIKMLPEMINQDTYDCYSFPRREFLSGVENTKPFPDYQDRLFRTYCRYVRPIHHELVGYKNKYVIPVNEGIEIVHSKKLQRHLNRNTGHNYFERQFKHEMSYPGAQLKETFIENFPHLNTRVTSKGVL